jgi:uncharacterized protein YndB with AHSA1/START domain
MNKTKIVAEPGKHAIIMTREFDAPREKVFKAMTDPALIPQWWGPRDYTTTVDRMEVRKGGIWRYVQRGAQGDEYGFNGIYHEVMSPERTVSTFEFEGMPGHVVLETTVFEDVGGRTRLTTTSIFQSVADRDGMIASGMEDGATQSWDRIAEILKTL